MAEKGEEEEEENLISNRSIPKISSVEKTSLFGSRTRCEVTRKQSSVIDSFSTAMSMGIGYTDDTLLLGEPFTAPPPPPAAPRRLDEAAEMVGGDETGK